MVVLNLFRKVSFYNIVLLNSIVLLGRIWNNFEGKLEFFFVY